MNTIVILFCFFFQIQDIDDCVTDDIAVDVNDKQSEFQSLTRGQLPQVDEVVYF